MMKEQKLVYTEKSAKPSLLKILFWLLAGDFVACILYGIAMGAGGSIDAQMEGAPAFLAELSVITAVLAILCYRLAGRRVTTISIYERTVIFSAPKVPMKDGNQPTGKAEPSPQGSAALAKETAPSGEDPAQGDAELPGKRVNPYLQKNRQKRTEKGNKPRKKSEIDESRDAPAVDSEKRIGKVTPDIPNSQVECPVEQLRSASRKGKSVVLILENGDRYLFVRMAGAERLVKVIEDKISAALL